VLTKANFAILHWFGLRFEPRFTDLNDQLQELYCADDLAFYDDFLIKPVSQIDIEAIAKEKPNIDRIVAYAWPERNDARDVDSQVMHLYRTESNTRAIFDFDKTHT